ncbi:MAG: hypothetical protein IJM71_02400 [Clostridia bacterium]|nr:hypothetical protein [Clostridia bacterium]
MKPDFEYTNSMMEHAIDEYIHNKQYRLILKLHYIDGASSYEIANHPEVTIQERQINHVLKRCLETLSCHM